MEEVEGFYDDFGDAARFQILPRRTDREIVSFLAGRDYAASDSSFVMTRSLPFAGGMGEFPKDLVCDVDTDASAWIDRWAALATADGALASELDVVRSIEDPAAFAAVHLDDELVGLGRAVLANGLLGFFNIYAAERIRRRGIGSAVMFALGSWGYAEGAREAYLQVQSNNIAGRKLYTSLGFGEAYRYHYLVHLASHS